MFQENSALTTEYNNFIAINLPNTDLKRQQLGNSEVIGIDGNNAFKPKLFFKLERGIPVLKFSDQILAEDELAKVAARREVLWRVEMPGPSRFFRYQKDLETLEERLIYGLGSPMVDKETLAVTYLSKDPKAVFGRNYPFDSLFGYESCISHAKEPSFRVDGVKEQPEIEHIRLNEEDDVSILPLDAPVLSLQKFQYHDKKIVEGTFIPWIVSNDLLISIFKGQNYLDILNDETNSWKNWSEELEMNYYFRILPNKKTV